MARILDGVDDVIDEFFGLTNAPIGEGKPFYPKKEACNRLCKSPEVKDGLALISRVYSRISANRKHLTQAGIACRGDKKNWRDEKQLNFETLQYEVRIQKAVAWLLDDWVNAVPTSSGITEGEETSRNIDLIWRISDHEAIALELKADRDRQFCKDGRQTPCFASMELLQYAMIWLYSKKHMKVLEYTDSANPFLKVKTVHLEVLMTRNCYFQKPEIPYPVAWLERLINGGLQQLGQIHGDIQFDFRFTELPIDFKWTDEDHWTLVSLKPKNRSGDEWKSVRVKPEWEALRLKVSSALMGRIPVPTREVIDPAKP